MQKKSKVLIYSLVLLLFLLAACNQKAPLTPSAFTASPQTPASRAAWQVEWEKDVAAAKKEGFLVIYCSASTDTTAAVGRGFKEKYNVDIQWVAGRGAEISGKLLAERRSGLYVADIYIGGTNTMVATLKQNSVFDPLEPSLLLPEILDLKAWLEGKLPWVDKDKQIFASLAFPTIAYAINTDFVKPEEVNSWLDLLNPRWKGKIEINDPTINGPGLRPFQAMLLNIIPGTGESYIQKLAQQEPILSRDQRLQVDWLAHNKMAILVGPDPAPLAEFKRAGVPLLAVVPKEGTVVTTGIGAISLVNKAPHPNAAKVFINWFLSKEGQTLYSKAYNAQSARLDVPTEGIEPGTLRVAGGNYYNSETEEYLSATDSSLKTLDRILGPLKK